MRAFFYEALLDACRLSNLGIEPHCLDLIMGLVDWVVENNHEVLLERDAFIKAYADFQEFVNRMIRSAQRRGFDSLREPTFDDAKEECGLVFFCD